MKYGSLQAFPAKKMALSYKKWMAGNDVVI